FVGWPNTRVKKLKTNHLESSFAPVPAPVRSSSWSLTQPASSFTKLDVFDVEGCQLTPARGAADQESDDYVVTLALESGPIGHRQEFLGLLASKPVAHTPH